MGKKSGPLAFLNKKGWHPGNQRNQEKVWKKEQEALAEKKQVEELRKQYDEARQKEEVEAMAVAAGVKKKQERLDWMYQGGMVAKQEAEKRADAQMLGEKDVDLPAAEEQSKVEHVAQLPAFYTQDTPASANEMWQKLHGDPMFAIKQQELMARKNIVSNPVQMDAIKKRLKDKAEAKAAKKAARAEAKAAKKAAKKAKKEKKRKRAKESSSSESESEASEEDWSPKRAKNSNGQAITSQRPRDDSPEPDRHNGRHRDRSERHQNGHSIEPRPGRSYHERDRDRNHGYDRDRRDHRDYDTRRDSRSHRVESSRGDRDGGRSERHRHDASDRIGEGSRHENGDRGRNSNRASSPETRRADRRERDGEDRRQADPEVKVYRDAASAQGRDLSYGLNAATNAAEIDRSEKRRETQKRLEEAKIRREAEEKEKAEQRYKRKEHKTGQISEEEKAKRLAEMSGNADAHEEARWNRLQAARKRDDSEAEAEALALQKKAAQGAQPGTQHHQDTAKFLQQATQEAFGGEAASLADRVSRRKYYNDRSRDESQAAFRRD